MKKYLVVGNPINHSLSPKLHNYWLKINNIEAIYDKKKLNEEDIENLILEIKKEKIKRVFIYGSYSLNRKVYWKKRKNEHKLNSIK